MIDKKCLICSKNFRIHNCREKTAKVCSASCRGRYIGIIKRKNVKPRISTQGYYFLLKPEHHRANKQGYVKVADLVLEEKIGRKLKDKEVAHHVNSIRTDDRPENLELMNKTEHDLLTTMGRWRKWKELGKWSLRFNKCVKCKTRRYKHQAKGHCAYCYKKYIERNENIRRNEKEPKK